MPVDKDVYPEPPERTPVRENTSGLPDILEAFHSSYALLVDKPVTVFHDWIERMRAPRKIKYYHRVYPRVPDLSTCLQDDVLCQFEAQMQWERDIKVDQEIVHIMRERFRACTNRELENAKQNCAKELEEYGEACKNYKSRYQYIGANGTARKCLMKQKKRMMEERKAAREAGAAPSQD